MEEHVTVGVILNSYLPVGQDGIIEDILHLTGRGAFLHLGPESNTSLFKQLHGHLILEGNNWRHTVFSKDSLALR